MAFKEEMTSKERLMAVLKGQKPDRTPWAPMIGPYYIDTLDKQNVYISGSPLYKKVVDVFRMIKADAIRRHVKTVKTLLHDVEFRIIEKDDEQLAIYETPVGSIKQVRKYGGGTWFKVESYIKSREDIKIYQFIEEHKEFTPAFDDFYTELEYMGESGIVTTSGPLTPIQSLLQGEMGIEAFTYGVFDWEEDVNELMAVIHHNNEKVYDIMAQSPSDVIIVYEDTSTTVLSPQWYDRYCKQYLDQYAEILHESGKIYITHMCGKLKGLLGSISEGLMDGIDAICPPSTGDTWAHEVREACPDKVLLGGIEPPALVRMDEDETVEYVRNVMDHMAGDSRFILSTGDAVSANTPIGNLEAISKLIIRL